MIEPAATSLARYSLYSAAGNRFALLDLTREPTPAKPAELARELCRAVWSKPAGFCPDGLLLFTPGTTQCAFGMILYNADGSRPEACGNGLRVLGDHALRSGYVASGTFWVETDAGLRRLNLALSTTGEPLVRALVAHPRILGHGLTLELLGREYPATLVDVGNPHCVLFVEQPEKEELAELGRAAQAHPRFPAGVNLELLAQGPTGWRMRVYERGVGETPSCGTGACAAAFAAHAAGLLEAPAVEIGCPGGSLRVERDLQKGAWLSGPLERLE